MDMSARNIMNLSDLPYTGLDHLTNILGGPNLDAVGLGGGMQMMFQIITGKDIEVGASGAALC